MATAGQQAHLGNLHQSLSDALRIFFFKAGLKDMLQAFCCPLLVKAEKGSSLDLSQCLLRLQSGSRLLSGSLPSSPRVPWMP